MNSLAEKRLTMTDSGEIQHLEERLTEFDDSSIGGIEEKIDIMNELAWLLCDKDPKRALQLSQAASALFNRHPSKKGSINRRP